MRDTFFYIEANIVCLIIFCFILFKNAMGVDRRGRQVCFDWVVLLHIFYFVFDSIWILLYTDTVRLGDRTLAGIVDVILFSIAAFGSYSWYLYAQIVLDADFVKDRRNCALRAIPALFTSVLAVTGFLAKADYWTLAGGRLRTTWMYAVIIALPFLYVITASGKAFYLAFKKENVLNRRQYVMVGTYPLAIILAGVLQIVFLEEPVLCFGCTIAMIYVYINSLDDLISQDPLTQLNNRNELKRFLLNSQRHPETGIYLLMMDVNKFKGINDRYGHLEGDRALRCVADSLREACTKCTRRHFIARYGGDEFIVAALADSEAEIGELCSLIHATVAAKNGERGAAYELALSIGYARLGQEEDAIQNCLAAADGELYKQKHRLAAR